MGGRRRAQNSKREKKGAEEWSICQIVNFAQCRWRTLLKILFRVLFKHNASSSKSNEPTLSFFFFVAQTCRQD
jgi:hypothetical protein